MRITIIEINRAILKRNIMRQLQQHCDIVRNPKWDYQLKRHAIFLYFKAYFSTQRPASNSKIYPQVSTFCMR